MRLPEIGIRAIETTARKSGGRFGWCATTKSRWNRFCKFCEKFGVSEIGQIDEHLLQNYARACGHLSSATAKNYLSCVNSVMKTLKKDFVPVSPKGLTGRSRSSVRKSPVVFTCDDVQAVMEDLKTKGEVELAAVVFLAANFGLRRRECVLMDIDVAVKEAKKNGMIDIVSGTKGGRGRYVKRLIPCNDSQLDQLVEINKNIKKRRSLIPEGMNLKEFYQRISNACIPVLKQYGVDRIHDLRVFYACSRYEHLTGFSAPCNRKLGDESPSVLIDSEAREKISNELGHSRIQIVSAYIGRKSRRGNLNAHQFNSGC